MNALRLDEPTAKAVVECVRRQYPNAKVETVPRGYGVSISPRRFVIVDPDDWDSDRKGIIRGIVEKAKGGDLEAVKFLLEHSDFEFPSFQVNGDEQE